MTELTIFDLERLHPNTFEVIVQRATCRMTDVREYLDINARHDWAEDWMHGEARSDPPEVKAQARYVFVDKEDAARFRMRFG